MSRLPFFHFFWKPHQSKHSRTDYNPQNTQCNHVNAHVFKYFLCFDCILTCIYMNACIMLFTWSLETQTWSATETWLYLQESERVWPTYWSTDLLVLSGHYFRKGVFSRARRMGVHSIQGPLWLSIGVAWVSVYVFRIKVCTRFTVSGSQGFVLVWMDSLEAIISSPSHSLKYTLHVQLRKKSIIKCCICLFNPNRGAFNCRKYI